jgi:hypothetical protein
MMNNIKRLFLFSLILIALLTSCQKRAVCPAYQHIDPTKKNVNMSKEKFVNSTQHMTDAQRKQDIEKRKNLELNAKHNRKNASNLFPSHMR